MSLYTDIMAMPADERAKLLDSASKRCDMEDKYREELDEVFGVVKIGGHEYGAAYALRAVDPTAYRCGFADFCGNDERFTEIEGRYFATALLDALYSDWLDR